VGVGGVNWKRQGLIKRGAPGGGTGRKIRPLKGLDVKNREPKDSPVRQGFLALYIG